MPSIRSACLVLSMLLSAACATGDGMQDKLRDATQRYNGAIRWGDIDRAAEYLPQESQQAFLTRLEGFDEKLVIVDFEVVRLDLDKKSGVAASRAEISWHTERELIVKQTRVDQLWQFHDGRFTLVDERRSGGVPLALFAETVGGGHPYLPGLDAYRKAHQIGEENKKRGRKGKKKRRDGDTAVAAR